MRVQWVCSRERRIALRKAIINQSTNIHIERSCTSCQSLVDNGKTKISQHPLKSVRVCKMLKFGHYMEAEEESTLQLRCMHFPGEFLPTNTQCVSITNNYESWELFDQLSYECLLKKQTYPPIYRFQSAFQWLPVLNAFHHLFKGLGIVNVHCSPTFLHWQSWIGQKHTYL